MYFFLPAQNGFCLDSPLLRIYSEEKRKEAGMSIKKFVLIPGLILCLLMVGLVQAQTPKRFLLRFSDAYLVYQPGTGTLQITTAGNVLSYGKDWQVAKLKPYLYHLRQNVWKDFFWKVNTSRKEVYQVSGGTFGKLGGQDKGLNITVDAVGSPEDPTRFLLRFSDAYLVHVPGTSTLQITAVGNVLSYGKDWQVKQMQPYLYHMRQNVWKGFYWKVNTSRKEVYRVRGGTFGKLGGQEEVLNITVDVVE
jgi:hypothetical protein